MFISSNDLEQHVEKENMMRTDHLASQLALIWQSSSESYLMIRHGLLAEHSSLRQLMPLMDNDISGHLQALESVVDVKGGDELVKERISRAWVYCHEQRIKLLYKSSIGALLVLPSALRYVRLWSCSITDGALAIGLGGLTSLKELELRNIMTLTTLPLEGVFQHLTAFHLLEISNCWCLRSLGGLRAATSLLVVRLESCPSLGLERGAEFLPVSLVTLVIYNCMLAGDFAFGWEGRSSTSLSVGHLSSLVNLDLHNMPDLCMIEGLPSLHLNYLYLRGIPNLSAECLSQCRVQDSLAVSGSVLLNNMLSCEGFTIPPELQLGSCNDTSFLLERFDKLTSVRHLRFYNSGIQSLPISLKNLSSLESLSFVDCPNLLSLPDLPASIQRIYIEECELLKESCQPNGENWPKIAHIRWKLII